MACRGGRQRLFPDFPLNHVPNCVDRLTSKYKMCKMESSTDSDSGISPRLSDTSPVGCVSSVSEQEVLQQSVSSTHKSTAPHSNFSLFLDPYDGSSENSDESNAEICVSSRQGRRRKRITTSRPVLLKEKMKIGPIDSLVDQNSTIFKDGNDVPMKCGSDSEHCDNRQSTQITHCDKEGSGINQNERMNESSIHIQTMEVESQLCDSDLNSTGSSSAQNPSVEGLNSFHERSTSFWNLRYPCKRKWRLPGVEVMELEPRKRQCVTMTEEDNEDI